MSKKLSQQEYYELQQLVDDARDRLITGEGASGVHYMLMHVLSKHGVNVMSREEAIKQGQRLCDEYLYGEQK